MLGDGGSKDVTASVLIVCGLPGKDDWTSIAIDSEPEQTMPTQSVRKNTTPSAIRIVRANQTGLSVLVGRVQGKVCLRRIIQPASSEDVEYLDAPGTSPRFEVGKHHVPAITSCEASHRSALRLQRSLQNAEPRPTVANLASSPKPPCPLREIHSSRPPRNAMKAHKMRGKPRKTESSDRWRYPVQTGTPSWQASG